jgi:hypothetical protein
MTRADLSGPAVLVIPFGARTRSGGRCVHCLAPVLEVILAGEWVPAELVADHYELHDCQPRAWHAVPASQPVESTITRARMSRLSRENDT